uniref:Uncharacterized protein n=1 Tax=Arundo donax TaxID=35708 RepID=A0A0A9BKM1_ARUDO
MASMMPQAPPSPPTPPRPQAPGSPPFSSARRSSGCWLADSRESSPPQTGRTA